MFFIELNNCAKFKKIIDPLSINIIYLETVESGQTDGRADTQLNENNLLKFRLNYKSSTDNSMN